jgi:hypothetical protein
MYVVRHLGVEAGAGHRQGQPSVAVDGVQGEGGAVPQVFRVREQRGLVPEILQEVVARAHGDAGHGGIFISSHAVGGLVGGPVAAAGVDPQRLSPLRQRPRGLHGVTGALGEDALHIQAVADGQGLGHVHHTGGAVLFPGGGIDDKYVLHFSRPSLFSFCKLSRVILPQPASGGPPPSFPRRKSPCPCWIRR